MNIPPCAKCFHSFALVLRKTFQNLELEHLTSLSLSWNWHFHLHYPKGVTSFSLAMSSMLPLSPFSPGSSESKKLESIDDGNDWNVLVVPVGQSSCFEVVWWRFVSQRNGFVGCLMGSVVSGLAGSITQNFSKVHHWELCSPTMRDTLLPILVKSQLWQQT